MRCSASSSDRVDAARSQVSSSRSAMPETEPRPVNSMATSGCWSRKAEISGGPSSRLKVSEPLIVSVSFAAANAAPAIQMPAKIHFKFIFMGPIPLD